MTKYISAILCTAILLEAYITQAQTKTAYTSVNDMVSIMPETAQINDVLEIYKKDSI